MYNLIHVYVVQIKVKYLKVSMVVVFGMNHEMAYYLYKL